MKIMFKNVQIIPITSEVFTGDVLVEQGKIKEIGEQITPDASTTIINGEGKFLLPGFIDAHTHLGLYNDAQGWAGEDANEKSEVMTPHIRTFDGIYPLDVTFQNAVKAGVTCVNVLPGSANVIGGTSCVIKTHGKNIEKMVVLKESGLKIALGENPKKHHSAEGSMTRMGIMGLLREKFASISYMTSEERRLPRNSSIVRALKREIPIRIHAHRSDDILSAIRLAEEFNLDLRIEHCTEGHLIVEELSRKNLQVTLGPTMTKSSKLELRNKTWDTYKTLVDNGVKISITTDHPYTPIQYLNIAAGISVREGLSVEEALKAITINPAENLGIDNLVGSIEAGKDADLVLWNQHPFHYSAKPVLTMINGVIVHCAKEWPGF